ncbi:MAG: hypothetical protein JWM95_1632 [Gemmatimonadetes bacterium]|nr:hypothetical protein [Gemmatimonadota bacterium]
MTALDVSTRDRRALILGGVVMLAVIALARGVPAVAQRYAAVRERASLATQRADRAQRAVRNASRTQAALRQVRAELATYDSALIQGNTPDGAAAELMQLVTEAAAAGDARVGSIQVAADTTGPRTTLAPVTARVTMSGDLMAVATMLQTLEAGPELLSVRELHISQSQMVRGQQVEVLQADLLVEGRYRRSREGAER